MRRPSESRPIANDPIGSRQTGMLPTFERFTIDYSAFVSLHVIRRNIAWN